MTISEQSDTQILKLKWDVLEIIANPPDGQKLPNGGSLDDTRRLAIVSASGGYDQNSGEFVGWITYGLFERKIKFQTTKFTSRLLSFHGTGGFLNQALPLDRLAGQTGTFSLSGSREVSLLWLWLGNDFVCVPLPLIGGGGMGHYAQGEVRFMAVD